MRNPLPALALTAAVAIATPVLAQTAPPAGATPKPPNEQVIEPTVPRREVRVPKIPSNDIIVGGYLGTYSSEDFGASFVYGVRLGYHITEDFFVEGVYGRPRSATKISGRSCRAACFPQKEEKLRYYNLSVGLQHPAG